ncbi:MAG: diguanylate cyclase [Sulfurimonas sp.]|uniref:GGDEF domain-containing protein n=1 Tax=Sulfurimonas sp. TaxID=2022749 RepID=UPI0026132763|nr:GGDEF domain-containing protein [Sulfurimonas sp.]MDD5371980.1 diguanylate cyclase [Sulfurimonas sp.]
MNIQAIIKNAVKRLEIEGKLLTPDFYAEAFCKEASKAGFTTEDCTHLEKFTATLNKEFQNELKKYHIKSMPELTRFLVSKLNRTNPSHCSNLLESQTQFTKRVLQVVEMLHNKEATELSKRSTELLSRETTVAEIDQYRQLWVNFTNTYDDTFLQKLKTFGDIDSRDLKKSIQNLRLDGYEKASGSSDFSIIASLLVSSFVPSIASSVNDKIAQISQKIQDNPALLEDTTIESEIKSAISLRIALDKQSVKEMIESIDGVLDKLSLRLIEMIESSDSSTVEIQKIKKELESYNESSDINFSIAHKKLYTIAVALEENTQALTRDLKKHNSEVGALSKKIEYLEHELERAKEESKEDFLTKLYNKRAIDEFINNKDAEFQRYGRNFAVVFFDLDYFKTVNDTYGHDAGDAVLLAFAKILKNEARSVDIVGRFGGEEFIAILGETDIEGGVIFAEKVRKKVKNARFMYKDSRIEVTVSCGVSDRKSNFSLQSLLKTADEFLYKAKKDGRDRVVSK